MGFVGFTLTVTGSAIMPVELTGIVSVDSTGIVLENREVWYFNLCFMVTMHLWLILLTVSKSLYILLLKLL